MEAKVIENAGNAGAGWVLGALAWREITRQDGFALLLAHDVVELRPYHNRKRCPEWCTSAIRAYLNGGFLQRFSDEERARIRPCRVMCPTSTRRMGKSVDTFDSIFLLSAGEVRQLDPDVRKAGCKWWLRTPGADSYYTSCVEPRGAVSSFGRTVISGDVGVRPAMWVSTTDYVGAACPESSSFDAADFERFPPSEWAFAALEPAEKLRVEADYLASIALRGGAGCQVFHDHALRQVKKLTEYALTRHDVDDVISGMIIEGLVSAHNIDDLLERVCAMRNPDLMAMLLDFKNRHLSAEDLLREERRRENEALRLVNPWSAEELKKVWRYRKDEDGAVITECKQAGPIMIVPETIGRTPVKRIECAFPRAVAHLILPDIEVAVSGFEGVIHASSRFVDAQSDFVEGCAFFEELPFGPGCMPETYVAAASLRQNQIRMASPAQQNEGYGVVVFGRFAWDVLLQNPGHMVLFARDIVDRGPYNRTLCDASWKDCTLRTWLNSEFPLSFNIREREALDRLALSSLAEPDRVESRHEIEARLSASFAYGCEGLPSHMVDSFFLLSLREARVLVGERGCASSAGWWLRDAGECEKCAAYMLGNGQPFERGGYVASPRLGIRPAVLIRT